MWLLPGSMTGSAPKKFWGEPLVHIIWDIKIRKITFQIIVVGTQPLQGTTEKYRKLVGDYSAGMEIRLYNMEKKIISGRAGAEMEYYRNCMERNRKGVRFIFLRRPLQAFAPL